jgi:RND family efflux transporter MFP subunit
LYRQQSATAKELDNITLQYQSAKARVESAKQMKNEINAQLNYTTLTAPFSGTVTRKMAEAGSMANPGMPLLTIEQTGALEIDAFIPESVIDKVKEGQAVSVSIPSANKNFVTMITRINPSSAFTGGQYTVKISIPRNEAGNLLSGMYAHISLPGIANNQVTDSAVWVPAGSLVQKDQLTGLYTVSAANNALLRWVRTGKTAGNMVEIISGLNNRESFILKSSMPLYNGAPVSITK